MLSDRIHVLNLEFDMSYMNTVYLFNFMFTLAFSILNKLVNILFYFDLVRNVFANVVQYEWIQKLKK